MFNLYLSNDSFTGATTENIEHCFKQLNQIISESDDLDNFWKHESLYDVQINDDLTFSEVIFVQMLDKQFMRQVLPGIMHKLKDTSKRYNSIEDFDCDYQIFNAFYGIFFSIKEKHLTCYTDYQHFRNDCIQHKLSPLQFSEIKDKVFDKLVFHIPAIRQIEGVKDPDLFINIIDHLIFINKSICEFWDNGGYNYNRANQKYNKLGMSMESTQTMNNPRLKKMREFTFLDQIKRCCELHAKISYKAYRIHMYADNKQMYIGYVGPHLKTSEDI